MTASRPMVTNVAINLAGLITPALAAAAVMPLLVHGFGTDRLGVLTLAWALTGAFTLLDFGLGRSLTREVARRRAVHDTAAVPRLVGGGLVLLTGAGAALGLLAALGAPAVSNTLRSSEVLEAEINGALLGVAAAIPFMTASSGLRGVLEAYGRFDLVNLARVPMGILTYVGPALVLPFTRSVAVAVLVIALARIGTSLMLLAFAVRAMGAWPLLGRFDSELLGDVLRQGAWMMVASLAGVALAYVDRLLLGAALPLAALAYYATPQELVGRLTILPLALSAVLFPALSGARNDTQVERLFRRALVWTFALVAPVAALGAAFAPELLRLWLGETFAVQSAAVVQWLSLSVLVQSLAIMPLSLLQALGYSAVTARLQVLQLPVFIAAVWIGIRFAGIEGAAMAWAGRMLLDLALSLWATTRRIPGVAATVRQGSLWLAATVGVFVALRVLDGAASRAALLSVGLAALAATVPVLIGREELRQLRTLMVRWSTRAPRGGKP